MTEELPLVPIHQLCSPFCPVRRKGKPFVVVYEATGTSQRINTYLFCQVAVSIPYCYHRFRVWWYVVQSSLPVYQQAFGGRVRGNEYFSEKQHLLCLGSGHPTTMTISGCSTLYKALS